MRKILLSCFILCLPFVLLAEEAKEKMVSIQLPIFAQLVQTKIPMEWNVKKPFFEKLNPNGHYIVEFAKKSKNNLLTIQGFKDAALRPNIRAKNMELFLSRQIKSLAPENFLYQNIAQTRIQGYDAVISLIGCSRLPKKVGDVDKDSAELGVYLFLKGKQDMYIVHRSWRTKAFDKTKKIPVKKAVLDKWVRILATQTNFL